MPTPPVVLACPRVRKAWCLVLLLLACAGFRTAAAPTNVVVVLMDDVGFSDLGGYGGEIRTPAMDGLARGGLRFRRFYNAARCSPSRCSLLTGLYPHQVAVNPANALPNLRNDNNVTLAEALRSAGYRTYMAGKWHLGTATGLNPWQRGFQHFWGFANGDHADMWNPSMYSLVSENGEVAARTYPAGQFYQSDAIGDYALAFLDHHRARNDGKPFFLFLAFGSAHFPVQAPKAMTDAYVAAYTQGWDRVRTERFGRMRAEGVLDPRHILSPREGTAAHRAEPIHEIPAWSTLPEDRRADLARRMAVYAGALERMDHNIGRVVDRLRERGELEHTLILVMSDNGGNHEGGRFGQTGGVVNAAPLTGASLDNMGLAGQPELLIGGGWAGLNNTPFRFSKHFGHEGGVRSPFIVHWPSGLSRTNAWEEQPAHLVDVMATVLDVARVEYPTQFNGRVVLPLEGRSLAPLFASASSLERSIGFEHEGNRALLSGEWKFVTKNFSTFDGRSPAEAPELYHLASDPVELTNLAPVLPTRVARMTREWNDWAKRVGVPASRLLPEIPASVEPARSGQDLFLDTFARPDATNVDATVEGLSGSRWAAFADGTVYPEGFEGSGLPTSIQVANGALQLAVGAGMAETGIAHNFIGADIVAAGGFSVEMTVRQINTDPSDAVHRYVGFGVGLSGTEARSGADIANPLAAGQVAFRGRVGGNPGVSDFFVELDLSGNVKVWSNGVLLDTVPVGASRGILTARFALAGFNAGDPVAVTVFLDGRVVDIHSGDPDSVSRTFRWDRTDSNFIGLSARASGFAELDNVAVRLLPVAPALATGAAVRAGWSGVDTAPEADPDGDGRDNLREWLFGGDPATAEAETGRLAVLPVDAATGFRFRTRELQDGGAIGISYRAEWSSTLAGWEPVDASIVEREPSASLPGYVDVIRRLPESVTAGKDRVFVRMEAGFRP